jgi:hypothetical protein
VGTCRHCKVRWATTKWKRGLCWGCYNDPAVRALYPTKRECRQGVADYYGPERREHGPLPGFVGTAERIGAYQERAARGVSLFG